MNCLQALGYRLSKLSFRLIDRTNGHQHYPAVAQIAGSTVDWIVEPLMSVAETHLLGSTKGNQVGDVSYTDQNFLTHITILFLCGKNLNFVRGQFLAAAGEFVEANAVDEYETLICVTPRKTAQEQTEDGASSGFLHGTDSC